MKLRTLIFLANLLTGVFCCLPANATDLTASSIATATSRSHPETKWHPGHYVFVYARQSEPWYTRQLLQDLKAHPYFRGIMKQYFWKDLEPREGVYDFSKIANDLDQLSRINKRLIVRVEAESFNTGQQEVPDYLQSDRYDGGVYKLDTGNGYNAAYYNKHVQDRMIALLQAMGKAFDSNPHLEMISLEETSYGKYDNRWVAQHARQYLGGMMRVAVAAKQAFPTTQVTQFINWPTFALPQLFQISVQNHLGVGGPDVMQNATGLINGAYRYFPDLSGIAPIMFDVEYTDYDSSDGGRDNDDPSIASIVKFAVSALHPNYMVWLRRTAEGNGSNHWLDVENQLNTYDWQSDPAGGMQTACPKDIAPCNTQ